MAFSLIPSITFSNMEEPTTPKHSCVTSIQLDSDLGRTPSQPTSHYQSSTKITEAKANLKTILATRISYNDPNIVDNLIKPNDASKRFVRTVMKSISEDPVITAFLTALDDKTIRLESEMYTPLVCCARYSQCLYLSFE